MRSSIPSLRFHAPTNRYYVWDSGQKCRRYLGRDKAEAERALQLMIAAMLLPEPVERLSEPLSLPVAPQALTVRQALMDYLERHAKRYFRTKSSFCQARTALALVADEYGSRPAASFGPLMLKRLQSQWITLKPKNRKGKDTLARSYVNVLVKAVRAAYRWLASEEIVPVNVALALDTVKDLEKGRGGRESKRVTPPPPWAIEATLEYALPTLAAMIRLHRACGGRPQDICQLRPCDVARTPQDRVALPGTDATVSGLVVDVDGKPVPVWLYVPASHKTLSAGKPRAVVIGPAGQAALLPYLKTTRADEYCFTPQRLMRERFEERRASRKSGVQPSQVDRSVRNRKRPPRDRFTTHSYSNAVKHTIIRANNARRKLGLDPIPHWTPNQLRHEAATRYGDLFGRETAREVLGQAGPDVIDVYKEQSLGRAAAAAARAG